MGLTVLNVKRKPDEWCRPCGLWKLCRRPIMNGEGSEDPVWEFVGEAPGADEDERGFPFCGEVGQLLREEIEAIGIPMQKCRFTNVVRCRPPKNDLSKFPKAIDLCRVHILREIRATNPKVVVLLGNSAIESVLHRRGIMKLHGEVFQAHGRHYVCSFHPSYFARNKTRFVQQLFRNALRIALRLGEPKKQTAAGKIHHDYIRDKKMLYEFTDLLRKQPLLMTDVEGSTLSPYATFRKPQVGCVGFAWDENHAICYPVQGRVGVKIDVHPEEVIEAIGDIWQDPDIKFGMHFGKYDYVYLAVLHGILMGGAKHPTGYFVDTGLGSYALNEEKGGHGLKDWAWRLGVGGYEVEIRQFMRDNPSLNPEQSGNIIFVPAKLLYPYNSMDCVTTFRLYRYLHRKLKADDLWDKPLRFPLMYHNWTAAMMEIVGIKTDLKRNGELQAKFPEKIEELEKRLRQFSEVRQLQKQRLREMLDEVRRRVEGYKRPVSDPRARVLELVRRNWKPIGFTPTNKRALLFDVMDYEPLWETPTGLPAIDKEALDRLNTRHPTKVLSLLMKLNDYYFGHSKYVKPIPGWVGSDGRTHTTYKPHGQRTGRVSSENPNHENLPKRGELANELNSQFVPTGGDYGFLAADEKQMEMRLFADRAQDDILIAEFKAGKDPHRMGAAAGLEISEEEVTKEMRDDAKSAISFGLLYGRGAEALAADMGWRVRKASRFINSYFSKYDDCYEYRSKVEQFVRKHGYVVSYFGRRRRLPGIHSENNAVYAQAMRVAINTSIQGDASDITWTAAWRMWHWLCRYKMRSRVVVITHDDIKIDYYRKELDAVLEKLYEFMTDRKFIEKMTGWYCSVPWDIDISLANHHLGELKELERTGKGCSFAIPSEFR